MFIYLKTNSSPIEYAIKIVIYYSIPGDRPHSEHSVELHKSDTPLVDPV
jgi:hypothetical protein